MESQQRFLRFSRRQLLIRSGLALSAISGISLLAACGPQAPTPAAPVPTSPAPAPATQPAPAAAAPTPAPERRGGDLVVAVSERSLTNDPANHYSISSTSVLRHIFDPLVDVTNDSKFVPALAESWEAIDNTTWRFSLRRGVSFHDGTPFNADSVLFTLQRVRDNSSLVKAFVYQDLDQVEKDGDYAVKVTTKRPFGSLPAHLTMLGMLPPNAGTNEEAFFEKPIGTGPFTFVEWTRGENVTLAANRNYWKTGVPRLDKITFRFIPEISTRAAGLRSGEIDIIDRIPPDMVATLKGTAGVKVLDTPAVEAQQWPFQLERDAVKDVRVRQAISLGIDRETIIKDLLLGYARPVTSPTPPGLIGHTDLGVKPYDPDKAKSLLQQAGKTGVTIDYVLMKDLYPKQLEIAQAVVSMLSDIGVTANVRNLEVAAAREIRAAGTYDLFYSGWAHMPHDPDWYFGQWFTKAGAEKLSRYNNPTVEQLYLEARVPDPQVRQQKYEELQRILWNEEEPTLWPYYSVAIYGARDRVQNFEARRDYYILLGEVGVQ